MYQAMEENKERGKIKKDEGVCTCSVQGSVGCLFPWNWATPASAALISRRGWKGSPTLSVIYPEHECTIHVLN